MATGAARPHGKGPALAAEVVSNCGGKAGAVIQNAGSNQLISARDPFGFRLVFDDFDDHTGGFEQVVVTHNLFAPLPTAIPLVCKGKKHALFRS